MVEGLHEGLEVWKGSFRKPNIGLGGIFLGADFITFLGDSISLVHNANPIQYYLIKNLHSSNSSCNIRNQGKMT